MRAVAFAPLRSVALLCVALVLTAILLAAGAPATAAGPAPVTRLFLEQVRPDQGRWLAPVPDRLRPGDRIVVVVAVPAGTRARLTQPVPASLRFTGAPPGPIAMSVDEGRTFGTLRALTVATGGARRAARATDVTHLRWPLDGSPTRLSFRATVR